VCPKSSVKCLLIDGSFAIRVVTIMQNYDKNK
jgi:hypothetical protein